MATMKIDDAERVEEVSGEEVVPVSKGGAPKALTVGQVKDYVAKAVSQASDESFDASTDRLAISRKDSQGNQSVVRCTLDDVANALYKSVEEIPEEGIEDAELANAKLVIYDTDDSKTVKSVTFSGLAKWMLDGFEESVKFDIGSLDEIQLVDDPSRTFFAAKVAGAANHVKISFDNVVRKFKSMLFASDESTVNSQTDSVVVSDTYGHVTKRTLKTLGIFDFIRKPNIAGRDLTGYIPRFASSDGSSFGAHHTVAESVDPERTDQLPTSAAVATAISEKFAEAGDVKKDGTSAEGDIVMFTSDGKVKSSGKKFASEIGENPDDTEVPTARAVAGLVESATENAALIGETATNGKLAKVGLDGKTLEGVEIKPMSLDLADPSDEKVATEKAVVETMKGNFARGTSLTKDSLVLGDGGGNVKAGQSVSESSGFAPYDGLKPGDNVSVPTTRYVGDEIKKITTDTIDDGDARIIVQSIGTGRMMAVSSAKIRRGLGTTMSANDVLTWSALVSALSSGKLYAGAVSTQQPGSPEYTGCIVFADVQNEGVLRVWSKERRGWYVFRTTEFEAN